MKVNPHRMTPLKRLKSLLRTSRCYLSVYLVRMQGKGAVPKVMAQTKRILTPVTSHPTTSCSLQSRNWKNLPSECSTCRAKERALNWNILFSECRAQSESRLRTYLAHPTFFSTPP